MLTLKALVEAEWTAEIAEAEPDAFVTCYTATIGGIAVLVGPVPVLGAILLAEGPGGETLSIPGPLARAILRLVARKSPGRA